MIRALVASVCSALITGCAAPPPDAATRMARISHVVVIYAENRSFDHLYGLFPGANGIARATPQQYLQRDHDGSVLPQLVLHGRDGKPDPTLPRLPNRPFRIDAAPINRTLADRVPSPTHAFFHHREQVAGGRNDMFVAMSNHGGWTMGHFDGSGMRLWQWAREYTLADNFFQGAFGGSYLNHFYLVCACAPRFADAPASLRARVDAQGRLERRPESPRSALEGAVRTYSTGGGDVTAEGDSVGTLQPPYQPSGIPPAAGGPLALADPAGAPGLRIPLPPQTARTIGDTLSAKGVSWAWYAAGWDAAVADGMQPREARRTVIYRDAQGAANFQPHHQPFNYFARFAPGTPDRARHLRDGEEFLQAIARGSLPAVSFYKPAGVHNQHPGYTDVASPDAHIADVLDRLRASPQWKDLLVIVTYDENGGFWDHVPPPAGPGWSDRFGPATRIPTLLVGPTVRRGHVDSTAYDTTSILKFITERFGLEPLPGVRERMGNLAGSLE